MLDVSTRLDPSNASANQDMLAVDSNAKIRTSVRLEWPTAMSMLSASTPSEVLVVNVNLVSLAMEKSA